MCLSVALGALAVIGMWALHPAFGAMSLYHLPPDVARRLVLSLSCEFGHAQVALLEHGPGFITPDALHGSLIGFPSYHCVLALVVCWCCPFAQAIALAVVGRQRAGDRFPRRFRAAIIWWMCWRRFRSPRLCFSSPERAKNRRNRLGLVNKVPKFALRRRFQKGFFVSPLEQEDERGSSAIKPKLSGFSLVSHLSASCENISSGVGHPRVSLSWRQT